MGEVCIFTGPAFRDSVPYVSDGAERRPYQEMQNEK